MREKKLSHSDTSKTLALAGGIIGLIMSSASLFLYFVIPFGFFFSGPGWSVVGIVLSAIILGLRTSIENNPLGIGITFIVLSTVYGVIGILPLAGLLIFIAGIFGIVEHHSRSKQIRLSHRRRLSDPSPSWKRTEPKITEEKPLSYPDHAVCSTCGSSMEPEDRYCVNCGLAR